MNKLKVVITFTDWSEPVHDYVWGDGSPEFIESVRQNTKRMYKNIAHVGVFPEDTHTTAGLIKVDMGPNASRDYKKR